MIALAARPPQALRLVGLIALSDPPREDSAGLIAALGDMHLPTGVLTGDPPATGAAIARKVGIAGGMAPTERSPEAVDPNAFGVFVRMVQKKKFRQVKAFQSRGLMATAPLARLNPSGRL